MSILDQPRVPRIEPRAWTLPAVTLAGLVIVLVRLWYLQIVRGEELSRLAVSSRTVSAPIPAPRGSVVDRNGQTLAKVRPALALLVTPGEVFDNKPAIARLCRIAGLLPEELVADIRQNMYRRYLPFVAKIGITQAQAIEIEEQRAFLPGIGVRPESVRNYPYAKAAAHTVGYVGSLSEADANRLKGLGDLPNFVGKVGIERTYDTSLMGRAGKESVQVDARGRKLSERVAGAPVAGSRVVLTIDADLQKFASGLLSGRKGAVLAINPATGEVLCAVSSPSYDPNLFAKRVSKRDWDRLSRDSGQPMHNRVVASAYAPGSTFKLATLTAGIRAGVVTPGTTFACSGAYRIGRSLFRCLGVHGRVDYQRAIERSCNVFFAEVARRTERDGIVQAAADYGLGSRTGIDLFGERAGVLPTDAWLDARGYDWYPGDTINLGVGQGYVSATPLQMANYAAIIANRGVGMRPHFVKALGDGADIRSVLPEEAFRVALDDAWWERIVRAMVRVVETGSGKAARLSGISVAGKTGSAEHGKKRAPHGWFIGFAPAENPRIAIAILVESAGQGGRVAAPLARRLLEHYLAAPPASQSERSSATSLSSDTASSGLPMDR